MTLNVTPSFCCIVNVVHEPLSLVLLTVLEAVYTVDSNSILDHLRAYRAYRAYRVYRAYKLP